MSSTSVENALLELILQCVFRCTATRLVSDENVHTSWIAAGVDRS